MTKEAEDDGLITLVGPSNIDGDLSHEGMTYRVTRGRVRIQNPTHEAFFARHGFSRESEARAHVLLGTDKLPANVDVGQAEPVQLGEVVRHAFVRSELTAPQWNELTTTVRDRLVTLSVIEMRDEAQLSSDGPPDFSKMSREGIVTWLTTSGVTGHRATEARASLVEAAERRWAEMSGT